MTVYVLVDSLGRRFLNSGRRNVTVLHFGLFGNFCALWLFPLHIFVRRVLDGFSCGIVFIVESFFLSIFSVITLVVVYLFLPPFLLVLLCRLKK